MNNSVQSNKDLVNQYKTNIDLVAYLDSIGYTNDKKRSSAKWVVMEDTDTARKLIVTKNQSTGHNMYFNPSDSRDKGSIIELVAEKMGLDLSKKEGWDQLHKACSSLIGNVYFTKHDHVTAQRAKPESRDEAISVYFKLDTLKNTDFLTLDRRLSPETIFAKEFENKVFNKPYIDKTYDTAGKNTAFPIENKEGIIGVINRNSVWNQIQGNKLDGVWVSNILPDKPVKAMVISEAPLDSMSFHQLNPPKDTGDRLYIATAGTLTAEQPVTIQYLINQTKPEQLILANDNDFQGIRYNINLMGKLLMPGQENTGITTHITNSAHTNTLMIEVNNPKTQSNGANLTIDAINERVHAVMNRGYPPEAPKAVINVITNRDDLTQIQVSFPNIRPLLIRAENVTSELRQCGDKVVVKRAMENDWNEDLQLKAIKAQVHTQLGIKLTPEQIKDLIKNDMTAILLNPQNDAGKIRLDYAKGQVTPQFVPRQASLLIPETFMGITLTATDAAQLKETGEMNRRVTAKHPQTNELLTGFVGVDADLKQLVFLRGDRLKNNNVYQTDVTTDQLKQIVKGETVTVNRRVKNADGAKVNVPVEMRVSATKGEIILLEKSVPTAVKQDVSLKNPVPVKAAVSKNGLPSQTASVVPKPIATAVSSKKPTASLKEPNRKEKPSIKVKVK